MKLQLKVGDKVQRSLAQEPWLVVNRKADAALIKRGPEQKWVKIASMRYTYVVVGSAKHTSLVAEYRRHKWAVWEEAKPA